MDYSKIVSKCLWLTRRLPSLLVTLLYHKILFGNFGIRSSIGRNSHIVGKKYIHIGDRCYFGTNLRLEAISSYAGDTFSPRIEIEDNVCINQNFHCTCAESLKIGGGTSITANCGIFDIVHPYEDVFTNPREAKIRTKPVVIGRDCLIGMNSVIMPGTRLGNHCVVGANSTVCGTFPDYCVVAGSPAKIIKKYDFEKKEWIRV